MQKNDITTACTGPQKAGGLGYTAKREQNEYTKRNRTSSFGVEESICKTQKLR
jgi:hypothetical protein